LEHKILKNLLQIMWAQAGTSKRLGKKSMSAQEIEIKTTAYDTFNHNIRMLNESMGMCLPGLTLRGP
jgi:hypothetical protein